MVYGSYLPEGTSIAKTSILVALADTAVALLAGGDLPAGVRQRAGTGGRAGADLCHSADRLRPDAAGAGRRRVVLRDAGDRRADLGHFALGAEHRWLTERFRISRTKAVLGSGRCSGC